MPDWDNLIEDKVKTARERGAKKRGWVVLRKSWLISSINYRMELSEQAVFSKLIVMADEFGPVPGLISDNDIRQMPHEYLAHQACCPLEVFESTLQKGITDDSLYENSHGIFLTHFDDYQFTEYDRQKPYRQKTQREDGKTYGEFQNILLTDAQYQKLVERLTEKKLVGLIEDLSLGIQSKGYKYKDFYATLLNWAKRDGWAQGRKASTQEKAIPKLCKICNYKRVTAEKYCPTCRDNGRDVELEKDWTGGKYGDMVRT